MSSKDLAVLERMYRSRFSHPIKHRFFEFLYGHKFDEATVPGYLRPSEGAMLYVWASGLPERSAIVEIGVLNGRSTCFLTAGARKSGSTVYSIDPFDSDIQRQERESISAELHKKKSKDEVMHLLEREGLDENVVLIEGFSLDVARDWERPIDFLWIDANHDQATQDYRAWRRFLRNGSRVAFHDAIPRYYGNGTVAQDVREIVQSENLECLEQVKSIVSFKIKL